MSVFRRGPVAGLLAAVGFLAAGCATARPSVEARPDGTKHLRCRGPLPDCLVEAERLCQGRHYAVLRAVDEHDRRGGTELDADVRTSEAIVRCGPAIGWPAGVDPMALPLSSAAVAPSPVAPPPISATPSPPARACVPGATQTCVGPAGCAGGQACLADGSGFAPCDCGADAAGVGRTR